MRSKLYYITRFVKSAFSKSGADLRTARELKAIANECIGLVKFTGRTDADLKHFHTCFARVIGVLTMVASYHDSIVQLCLAGQALNSSALLRIQLEAHLILCYLTYPDENIEEIEKRVQEYEDWVCIRMYLNSKKSKDFSLFTLNPEHAPYLKEVEENYQAIKDRYIDRYDAFKELERSQSFLKDKRKIAREHEIEDLYLAIFAETSATVHLADISDRMQREIRDDFDGYSYALASKTEAMMMIGVSNIVLLQSITRYFDALQLPKELQKNILSKLHLSKNIDDGQSE